MFENVGRKLKIVAEVFMVVEMLGAVLGGIVVMANGAFWYGLGLIIGGILAAYITALFLYGYGQLVENSDAMTEDLSEIRILLSRDRMPKAQQQDDVTISISDED